MKKVILISFFIYCRYEISVSPYYIRIAYANDLVMSLFKIKSELILLKRKHKVTNSISSKKSRLILKKRHGGLKSQLYH